jgi:hypothetical protein
MGLPGNRFGARAGVVALVATGTAVLLAAPPALAEPGGADLQFRVPGTTVVELASKPFFVQMHNNGPADAENIVVKVDLGDLDTTKLGIQPPVDCNQDGTIYECPAPSLAPGEFNNLFSPFTVTSLEEGASGSAGSFTVEVTSDTPDPKPENNQKVTVPVTVAPMAFDLVAIAQDVWDGQVGERVAPGATVPLVYDFVNLGTLAAAHLVWKVTLPQYVTFAKDEQHDGCVYNDKRTEATCELPDAWLNPGEVLAAELGDPMLVTVAPDAPGPGALVGGIVAGGARRTQEPKEHEDPEEPEADAVAVEDFEITTATAAQRQKAAAAANDENSGGDADECVNEVLSSGGIEV